MKKLTTWQRLALVSMYAIACEGGDPLNVWFTRRAIEHMGWFDWHGYHTRAINELVVNGWLISGHTEDGIIAYKLTAAAHGSLSVDAGNCIANVRYASHVTQGELFS